MALRMLKAQLTHALNYDKSTSLVRQLPFNPLIIWALKSLPSDRMWPLICPLKNFRWISDVEFL